MSKQKEKSTDTRTASELLGDIAIRLGTWVLTAAALIASTEMLHHTEQAAMPVSIGSGHSSFMPSEGMSARAEGTRETARLPEDYDVGLRMPAISGE